MQKAVIRNIGEYAVRQCSLEDISQVIAVNWEALPEHYSDYFFQEILRESPETFLVAEKDGKIVGYIMCRIEYGFSTVRRFGLGRKGHIVSVAVTEQHRGKGLGRTMVEEAVKAMKEKGCSEAYLEVRVSNLSAVELYEKLGFGKTSKIDGYYKDGEGAYLMSKSPL